MRRDDNRDVLVNRPCALHARATEDINESSDDERGALVRPGWLFEIANALQARVVDGPNAVDSIQEGEFAPASTLERDLLARIRALTTARLKSLEDAPIVPRRTGADAVAARRPLWSVAAAAMAHLERHCDESWTLERLARRVGCNRTYLETLFRAIAGYSVHEYLTLCRVRQGQQLLRTTQWRVEAVANEVGYRSKASLYRNFRRVTGMSPDEYRSSWEFRRPNSRVLRLVHGR